MRDVSQLTNAEKVQIHFMFHEMKHGYVQIARMYDIKAVSVIDVIAEVDMAKSEFQTREPVVYRKHYVNPNRGKSKDMRLKLRKNAKGRKYETVPTSLTPEKSLEISRASAKMPVTHGPTGEALEALLNKFNK